MRALSPHPIVDFAGLLTNLAQQQERYDALLALSEREREAIAQDNLADLAAIVAAKEQLVIEAQVLEHARQEACTHWAQQWALSTLPTLSDLRQHADSAAIAARLDAAAIALSQRVRRLRYLNGQNARLIAQVQSSLSARMLQHTHHPLYDQHGDTTADRRSSVILDYRV